jgi:hypothetical protein
MKIYVGIVDGALPVLLIALATPACRVRTRGENKPMPFRLQDYQNEESARIALERELPKGTSRDRVLQFLKAAEIPCFDEKAEVLACRLIEPSSTMVHVVWQLAFHFDARKNLERIYITRGFVGP